MQAYESKFMEKTVANYLKEVYKGFQCRSIAQPGSAHVWGACGRGFKSRCSDHYITLYVHTYDVIFLSDWIILGTIFQKSPN